MNTKVEYKNKNALIALEVIIALIGLVVLIIGIFLIARTINFNSNSERIEAIVEACEKYIEENNDGTSTLMYCYQELIQLHQLEIRFILE